MSESMTIDQVREERRILAEQIHGAVKAFNEKTGLSVEYVNLQYVDLNAFGEISRQVLTSVEVELNI
ncbi:hypothetical protein DM813_19200 [Pseudomonas alkylphenolica]|uniref:Uncharacterized protein n=1 Tax=Pseudomonas alkylphenolica TaxID=237609 RepID=A0A443ZQE8_9PSED|nr:hypothetical protein [Pseudomonas alkylphenolica]RWU21316.1 hypothetical protein DM813_19200 [Pseudomonas alkylphenolica]